MSWVKRELNIYQLTVFPLPSLGGGGWGEHVRGRIQKIQKRERRRPHLTTRLHLPTTGTQVSGTTLQGKSSPQNVFWPFPSWVRCDYKRFPHPPSPFCFYKYRKVSYRPRCLIAQTFWPISHFQSLALMLMKFFCLKLLLFVRFLLGSFAIRRK